MTIDPIEQKCLFLKVVIIDAPYPELREIDSCQIHSCSLKP